MSIQLNQGNFEDQVMNSPSPVLVDFWGTGCGPCMNMAPLVDRLAETFEGTARVGKVNVVDEMDLAIKYGIRQIPVLMVFKNGAPVDKMVGQITEGELTSFLEAHLDPA